MIVVGYKIKDVFFIAYIYKLIIRGRCHYFASICKKGIRKKIYKKEILEELYNFHGLVRYRTIIDEPDLLNKPVREIIYGFNNVELEDVKEIYRYRLKTP